MEKERLEGQLKESVGKDADKDNDVNQLTLERDELKQELAHLKVNIILYFLYYYFDVLLRIYKKTNLRDNVSHMSGIRVMKLEQYLMSKSNPIKVVF